MSSATSGRSRLKLRDVELSAILSEAEVGNLDWRESNLCPGAVCARLEERGHMPNHKDGDITCYDTARGSAVSNASNPNVDAGRPVSARFQIPPSSGEDALLWMRQAGLVR